MGWSLQALDEITAAEYQRWVRYYNAEPWGFPREDVRAANITSAVLRASGNKWSHDRELSPHYWLYSEPREIDRDTIVQAWRAAAGSNIVRRRNNKG